MKKLSIILFLFCSAILVSCEEELLVYDNVSGQSFLKFEASTVDLPVPRTGEETISIPVSVSTISSSERTVTVSVVEDETSLDAANYTFTNAVIPANSYVGSFQVTGTNASLVVGVVETLTFELGELSTGEFFADSGMVTARAFLSCPFVPEEFVGSYTANATGYPVEVTYDAATQLFKFTNLNNVGGTTYAKFSYENNTAAVDFAQDRATNFGVLQVNATFGNVYAVNPSIASGSAGDNVSTFRTCDAFIDLFFRRQIQDGRFFAGVNRVSLTKVTDSDSEDESEDDSEE